jgi:hypothetical protein
VARPGVRRVERRIHDLGRQFNAFIHCREPFPVTRFHAQRALPMANDDRYDRYADTEHDAGKWDAGTYEFGIHAALQ